MEKIYCKGLTRKEYQKQYRLKNKKRLQEQNKEWVLKNKDKKNEYARKWYSDNKDKISKSHKESYKKNGYKWKATRRKHYINNKESYKKRNLNNAKKRIAKDPIYRMSNNLRSGLISALKGNKKHKKTLELLGCDIVFFKKYLESKFKKGMTWENYGAVWHIDHIYPVSKLDLSKEENQRICFHYTNMQPLFAEENIKKFNKILPHQTKIIL